MRGIRQLEQGRMDLLQGHSSLSDSALELGSPCLRGGARALGRFALGLPKGDLGSSSLALSAHLPER